MIASYRKPTILIVEDQNANIDLLRVTLRDDYYLQIAKTGADAIRIVSEHKPDLILLDIGLPDMDGFSVYRNIQNHKSIPNLPVIFLTVSTEEQDETKGLKLGAVDFIHKPFCPAVIRNRIKKHLELFTYRKELEAQVVQRTQEIQETQKGLLTTLALATECRNVETGGHIQRTREIGSVFMDQIFLHQSSSNRFFDKDLYVEAILLHDVGKIGIPDSVLTKPSRLTADEYEVMKRHPQIGRDLLMKALLQYPDNRFLTVAVDMASYHHERWDGSGYPFGLKGTEIPLAARIMAIVDVYEALTADRVYRKAMSHDKAIELMRYGDTRTKPYHFDPELLIIFLNNHEDFRGLRP